MTSTLEVKTPWSSNFTMISNCFVTRLVLSAVVSGQDNLERSFTSESEWRLPRKGVKIFECTSKRFYAHFQVRVRNEIGWYKKLWKAWVSTKVVRWIISYGMKRFFTWDADRTEKNNQGLQVHRQQSVLVSSTLVLELTLFPMQNRRRNLCFWFKFWRAFWVPK